MAILYIASRNIHKVAEFERLLAPLCLKVKGLPAGIPEAPETGRTFLDNARQKAIFYARYVSDYVLADDSGLTVPALNGEPGVFSARYAGVHGDDAANNRKLLMRLAGKCDNERLAEFVCALVLYRAADHTELAVEGRLQGCVLQEERGQAGFGYDPLFYVPHLRCTLAEMSMAEKNHISHRYHAVQQLLKLWEGQGDADMRSQ